ncbi:uncharacterized protein LOC118807451 [Colossoma macropomum]|uniref:uncharacterized protein LOC118807451 n=1 Tax=Colossoma macropomum TaxID=42526 RepID=UPI0018647B93|nr:uncharacterized protein LOC118807451 [Colossoma macropomum]
MKRREPPLTSSGVRRRARLSLVKRLHDIAEDCQLTSEQTVVNRPDPCHAAYDTDSDIDSDSDDDFDTGLSVGEERTYDLLGPGRQNDLDCTVTQVSSGSEAEDFTDAPVPLVERLSKWAVRFNISLVALTALLCVLRVYHPDLPRDARTVLKTQTQYSIHRQAGGLYHYRGILTSLRNTLSHVIDTVSEGFTFRLRINVDGLPGLLLSVPMKEPVVIGLFCGKKKPSCPNEFLRDFTCELQQLQGGFFFSQKKVFIKLDSVICDAPARAFIKNVKGHNAYHGCDKCCQPGVYINNRMTYPLNDYTLRTDISFLERTDESHHHEGPHGFANLDSSY